MIRENLWRSTNGPFWHLCLERKPPPCKQHRGRNVTRQGGVCLELDVEAEACAVAFIVGSEAVIESGGAQVCAILHGMAQA